MALDERWLYLLAGIVIGFVVGYLVRLVQDIKEELDDVKEELDEVDQIVKKELGHHDGNEHGFMRNPVVADIAILLIVGLVAYASFASQRASNDVDKTTNCNVEIMSEALNSLNERSTYTSEQARANVDLQTDFKKFFDLLLHQPPFSEEERRLAAQEYQESLTNFVELANKTREKVEENPFPTVEDLETCIEE